MKLEKFKLKDFGIIENGTFNLSEGITLFSGGNGQGKSTILKAFSMLFLNKFKGTLKDYIRWGSSSFYIEAIFSHGGESCTYEMTYDGSTKRILKVGDSIFVNSDALSYMAEKFDPTLTLASAISFAGEIDVVNVSASERREHLKKIFNVDFSSTVQKFKDSLSDKDEELQEMDKRIFALENKSYFLYPLARPLLTEAKRAEVEIQVKDLESDLSIFRSEKERIDNAKIELEASTNRLSSLEKSKTDVLSKIESSGDKHETLLSKKQDILSEEPSLENRVKEFEESDPESAINSLQDELSAIQIMSVPEFDEDELEKTSTEVVLLERDLNQANSDLEMVEDGKCPKCNREFLSSDKKAYEDAIDSISSKLQVSKDRLESLKEQQKEFKRISELNLSSERKMDNVSSKLEQAKKSLEDERNSIKVTYKKDYKVWEESLESVEERLEETQEQLSDLKVRVSEIDEEILEIESKVSSLQLQVEQEVEEPVEKIELLEELKSKLEKHKEVLQKNEIHKRNNQQIEAEEEADKLVKKDLYEKKNSLLVEVDEIKEARKILQSDFPTFIISTIVQNIQNTVNDFLVETYEGRYDVKIKEAKNSLQIVYGPNEQDVSLASDYERQVFSIAYKYALSKLNDLGFIILDEVDSFAEDKNSIILYDTIGKMQDLYQQVFVITHKEETKDILSSDYNANVFELIDGVVT